MPTARPAYLRHAAILVVAVCALGLMQSCGAPGGTPAVQTLPVQFNQPQESVRRLRAPDARTQSMMARLNRYRLHAFGSAHDVQPSDELYTAAFRHAVYLNTKNSKQYTPNPPADPLTGAPGSIGMEQLNIVPSTPWPNQSISAYDAKLTPSVMHTEDIFPDVPIGEIYPALVTHADMMGRLQAVVGGPGIMSAVGASESELYEDFVINGDVWLTSGAISQYRGYDLNSKTAAGVPLYNELDSIWYSRQGRSFLMRSSLKYLGYGAALDDGRYTPPWPIMFGRFAGVMMGLASRPLQNELSVWPTSNNTGADSVNRLGTSTDVNAGPNQYSGTPIHITLPSALPFYKDISIRNFTFDRTDAPAYPTQNNYRFLQFYSNVKSLSVGIAAGAVFATPNEYHGTGAPLAVVTNLQIVDWTATANLPGCMTQYTITLDPNTDFSKFNPGDRIVITWPGHPAFPVSYTITGKNAPVITVAVPCQFDPFSPAKPDINTKFDIFLAVSTGVTAIFDAGLANAELMIVPVAPLEPNATYHLRGEIRTPDYPLGSLPYEVIDVTFTTNNK
jgi:hypothetical protein